MLVRTSAVDKLRRAGERFERQAEARFEVANARIDLHDLSSHREVAVELSRRRAPAYSGSPRPSRIGASRTPPSLPRPPEAVGVLTFTASNRRRAVRVYRDVCRGSRWPMKSCSRRKSCGYSGRQHARTFCELH